MGRKNKQNKKQNTVNLDKSSAQKPEKEIQYKQKKAPQSGAFFCCFNSLFDIIFPEEVEYENLTCNRKYR